MKLIPQKNTSSCWYASVQMVVMWKRSTTKATLAGHPDASQVPQTVAWEVAANGLVNENVLRMAQLLGLRSVPPQSLSLAKVANGLPGYQFHRNHRYPGPHPVARRRFSARPDRAC